MTEHDGFQIEFEAPVGSRILNHGWFGVCAVGLWHFGTNNKWGECGEFPETSSTHDYGVKSYRAFLRYLTKHKEELKKAREVILVSRFTSNKHGYCIIAKPIKEKSDK